MEEVDGRVGVLAFEASLLHSKSNKRTLRRTTIVKLKLKTHFLRPERKKEISERLNYIYFFFLSLGKRKKTTTTTTTKL